jgi:hypothetical protein
MNQAMHCLIDLKNLKHVKCFDVLVGYFRFFVVNPGALADDLSGSFVIEAAFK